MIVCIRSRFSVLGWVSWLSLCDWCVLSWDGCSHIHLPSKWPWEMIQKFHPCFPHAEAEGLESWSLCPTLTRRNSAFSSGYGKSSKWKWNFCFFSLSFLVVENEILSILSVPKRLWVLTHENLEFLPFPACHSLKWVCFEHSRILSHEGPLLRPISRLNTSSFCPSWWICPVLMDLTNSVGLSDLWKMNSSTLMDAWNHR